MHSVMLTIATSIRLTLVGIIAHLQVTYSVLHNIQHIQNQSVNQTHNSKTLWIGASVKWLKCHVDGLSCRLLHSNPTSPGNNTVVGLIGHASRRQPEMLNQQNSSRPVWHKGYSVSYYDIHLQLSAWHVNNTGNIKLWRTTTNFGRVEVYT